MAFALFEIKNFNVVSATPMFVSNFWEKIHFWHLFCFLSYVHIQSKKYVIQVRTKRSSSRRSQNSILGGVKKERLPSQDSDGGANEDRCVKEIEARW